MVAGEVKAGKSSLLNALFGRDFCRVDVLPATDRVHVFKFGEEARDVAISPSLIERYQPIPFLRDFNIVDTPGTNTIVSEHEEITERFVPQADLIIFVFSVVNPWGASAWEFLALLQKKWLKNVIFVLQQMDLRDAAEVEAVSQHLRQTAMQRLGQSVPIFAVSAKKAWLAKTGGGADKEQLWAESQFGPLEDHINGLIAEKEVRRTKLKSVCQTAQVILRDLSEKARGSEQIIAADREQLRRLQATVAQLKQRSYLQVEGFLRGVDTAYARCQQEGERRLQEKLGFVNSLKLAFVKNQQWQIDFQREMETMLRAAITKQMERAVTLMEGESKPPGASCTISCKPTSTPRPAPTLKAATPISLNSAPGFSSASSWRRWRICPTTAWPNSWNRSLRRRRRGCGCRSGRWRRAGSRRRLRPSSHCWRWWISPGCWPGRRRLWAW